MARLLFVAAAICGGCLGSCSDDAGSGLEKSNKMAFRCSISAEADSAIAPRGAVAAFEGWSSPLYLHTFYVDTIATREIGGATRAAKQTDMYDDGFCVTAYLYTDEWSEEEANDVYFYNQQVAKNGVPTDNYYWPGKGNMRFFAYAPTDNESYTISDKTQAGEPTVTVTVPSDVAKQQDLLVAASGELDGNHNAAIDLDFRHALAAVRFECGSAMQKGTVKSITIDGICYKGTYKMKSDAWEIDTETTSFTQELNKEITDASEGEDITTEAQTFMMVPQTLAEGATLTVVFVDSENTEHTLPASIAGNEWVQGKTLVYKISTNSINWSYKFSVAESMTFDHTGGTKQYTVSSYKKNLATDEIEPVAWKVTGYDGSDTKPAWLETFTASGSGSETEAGVLYNAVISPQTVTETDSHTYLLETATAKGSEESPYNLATKGGTTSVSTANCYMVSAPGYYSFPLVYGNAIKNGETNESAYKTDVTGDYVLPTLVNHLGAGITNPYIKNNDGCTPYEAELVWQDAENLVTEVGYDSENEYISFHVDPSTIRQGNAVIAIKDAEGSVLWSWHIWVTDTDIDTEAIAFTNSNSETINFSPINLGWCAGETMTFEGRSCVITFAQEEEGDGSGTITVTQSGTEETISNYSPYYQWGRKDPLPSYAAGGKVKTWYNTAGEAQTALNIEAKSNNIHTKEEYIKKCILNPGMMTYCTGDNDAQTNTYTNLWNINDAIYEASDGTDKYLESLEYDVVKTIYDPSPVGFSVPKGYAFLGFSTKTGTYSSSGNVGWTFNAADEKTIFFPRLDFCGASFGRRTDSSIYWSAVPCLYYTGYYMQISNSVVSTPKANSGRKYGGFVRPAKETEE